MSRPVRFWFYDHETRVRKMSIVRNIADKFSWAVASGDSIVGLHTSQNGAIKALSRNRYRALAEVVELKNVPTYYIMPNPESVPAQVVRELFAKATNNDWVESETLTQLVSR